MTSMEEVNQRPSTLKRASSYYGRETKRRRIRIIIRSVYEMIEIPNDVVKEILVKLPVKSLMRFQFVSKHWKSLIRSTEFKERYMAHQKSKDPKLLSVPDDFVTHAKKGILLKSMALGTTSPSLEKSQSLKYRDFKGLLNISESCDGIVCIYGLKKAVQVINPATGMCISLPLAKVQRRIIEKYPELGAEVAVMPFTRFGFGKDSVTGRYKLVWLYNTYRATRSTSELRCEVLDLEERKWRFVSTTPLDHHHILYSQRPAFANGSFYWLTGDERGDPTTQTKLIVFDIHTEMFHVTATPRFIARDACGDKIGVCNLDGRLCVSELKGDCTQEFWWRVKDNAWEKIFSVDLRSTSTWFGGITWEPLTPLAISKDSNKVILSLTYQDSLVSFDLDPHSTVYHQYYSGYYGLAVPYFPS